ncbi:MAG: transposase [Bryobacteraceae bacterium]|nr:transposase [Bryobacteraceae bacterium]
MPRLPRFVLPGYPHHVTQRGNDRQQVFLDEQDYGVYRRRLFAAAAEYEVTVLAFCLMPNHIHAICVPRHETGLTRMFRRLQGGFSLYSNVRRARCGHLWQERFYSCVMDHNHTFRAMAYIEQNPLRAALVQRAEDWPWSSAGVHLAGEDPARELDLRAWSDLYTPAQWKLVLATSLADEAWIRRFRSSSQRGYALADEQFIAQFQAGAHRNLSPAKPGPRAKRLKHTRPDARSAAIAQAG